MKQVIKKTQYLEEFSQYYPQKRKGNYKKPFNINNIISIISSSLSININQKDHFFPADFFDPIYSPSNSNKTKTINYNNQNKTKSTYVNLQKEEEEDKELLDLLEGKRKIIYF